MTPTEQQVLAAWISAGAAVVQAIGAIGAIVAAVILARSSARREKLADEAAERRAAAADAAAERRRIDADAESEARIEAERDAADRRRHEEERERYNRPIDLMLKLGEQAKAELQVSMRGYEARAARLERSTFALQSGPQTALLQERAAALVEEAETASAAAAIRAVATAFTPFGSGAYGSAQENVDTMIRKIAECDAALSQLSLLWRDVGER